MVMSVRTSRRDHGPGLPRSLDSRRRNISITELIGRHRRLASSTDKGSLRAILRRHAAPHSRAIRFLHFNTYLLDPNIHLIEYVDGSMGGAVKLLLCLGIAGPEAILRAALGLKGKAATCALFFHDPISYTACLAIPGTDKLIEKLISKVGDAIDVAVQLAVPTHTLLLVFGIDINIPVKAKRLIDERADEIGQSLAGNYDLISLNEVWRQRAVDRILQGWGIPPLHFFGNGLEGDYKEYWGVNSS